MKTKCPECGHEFQDIDIDACMAEARLMREVLDQSSEAERLRNAIRSFVTAFDQVQWGWDGDCGSGNLVEVLFESLVNTQPTHPETKP